MPVSRDRIGAEAKVPVEASLTCTDGGGGPHDQWASARAMLPAAVPRYPPCSAQWSSPLRRSCHAGPRPPPTGPAAAVRCCSCHAGAPLYSIVLQCAALHCVALRCAALRGTTRLGQMAPWASWLAGNQRCSPFLPDQLHQQDKHTAAHSKGMHISALQDSVLH